METFFIEIIRKAFKRCYGLQQALKDEALREASLDSLANQSGIRRDYLADNVNIIINL